MNRAALERLVRDGAAVEYFDHHFTGDAPLPGGVVAHIDTSPHVCTGMLVDRHLHGRQRIWAVVAAFGDNLVDVACDLAAALCREHGRAGGAAGPGRRTDAQQLQRPRRGRVDPAGRRSRGSSSPSPIRFDSLRRARCTRPSRPRDAATSHSRATSRRRTCCPGPGCTCCPMRPGRGACAASSATRSPTRSPRSRTRSSRCARTATTRSACARRARVPTAPTRSAGSSAGNGRAAAAGIGRLPREELGEFVARLAERYA